MAVEFQDQNKDKNLNMDSQSNSGGVNVSGSQAQGGGSSPSGPAPAGGGSSPNSQGTSSGRFSNVTKYLQANQGYNAQGGGLAGQVAGNIQNQYNTQQQGVQQAQNDFNTQANANRRQYDPNAINNVINDPYAYLYGQKFNPTTTDINPASTAMNQSQYNQFMQNRNAQYQGPTALANPEQLQAQAQNVQQLTSDTGTQQGRYGLLRQMYGSPGYSSGQQKLDQLLLQSDPQQQAKLAATRALGGQAVYNTQQAQGLAQNQANQYQQEAQNTQNQTRAALLAGINQFGTDEQAKADAANAATNTAYQNLINSGQLSQDEVNKLGLSNLVGQGFLPSDLSQYFTKAPAATAQTAASAADYAKIAALQKLGGDIATDDASKVLARFGDTSQADAYSKGNDLNVQLSMLQNAINQNKQNFAQDVQQPLKEREDTKSTIQTIQGMMPGEVSNAIKQTQDSLASPYSGSNGGTSNAPKMVQRTPEQTAALQQLLAQQQQDAQTMSPQDWLAKYNPSSGLLSSLTGQQNILEQQNQSIAGIGNKYNQSKTLKVV